MTIAHARGRPRGFDLDDALDAALELFWREGFRATSTRDLEATLGVNQSSLYHAFGSKAELLAAALDRYERRIDAALVEPLEGSPLGLEAIEDFFSNLHRWITHDGKRGCLVINLMAEDGGADTAITRRTRRYRRRVRSALHTALDRAARSGEIAPTALDERSELLFGMVLGLNIAVRGGASRAEIGGIMTGVQQQIGAWRLPQPATE
ncbi:MAG: TetR/AcrR family transcriptional regulator [Nitriliruptoraceae bacterium]